MSRTSITRASWLCCLLALAFPAWAAPGLCGTVAAGEAFRDRDRAASDYFDRYFIRRDGDAYRVLAVREMALRYDRAVAVMSKLEHYPEFMPGYRGIRVAHGADGIIRTAIRFRMWFQPFESRFTNAVRIHASQAGYRQCWRQLAADDPRVLEPHRDAPGINEGYWRLTPRGEDRVELRYFSRIEPPTAVPGFIYRWIVRASYEEVFERIAARVRGREAPAPVAPRDCGGRPGAACGGR